jgi:hypothetical protein
MPFSVEKLTTPLKYAHYAVVTRARGTTPFPVDMLRYDRCYPLREIDSVTIGANISDPWSRENTEDQIFLVKYSEKSDVKGQFTTARWDSFGWLVMPVERQNLPG